MDITHTQPCTFTSARQINHHQGGYIDRYTTVSINCSTLPGSFSLCVNDKNTAYTLSWTAVTGLLEIVGGCISLSRNGATVASVDIWPGKFPSSFAGGLEIPFTTFHASFDLAISLEMGNKQDEQAKDIQTLAARSSAIVVNRSPNNVCFDFPRTSQQLWSNEDNLRKLSTYYASLLSSDFAEGSTTSQLVPISSSLVDYTYEDSDAETDGLEVGPKVKSKKGEKPGEHEEQDQNKESIDSAPFKTVPVVDTAYTTYFAVLVWIATGYIRFAPLRSKFTSDARGAEQARAAEIDKMLFSHSDLQLPPPASPKSVYRLAHLLELPELLQLAFDNYKSQISAANVAYELYSDVSCSYEAIRDVALEFAVAHWKEVGGAEGTREMERRAYAEELPKAATRTSMLLARKLMAEYGGM
ncbi:hypothetical protein JCM5296_001048 [Sporobolomyces johnsonii]